MYLHCTLLEVRSPTFLSLPPHFQPQFCSTPATMSGNGLGGLTASGGGGGGGGGGVEGGQRQVLGSLASQENTKQQVGVVELLT